MTTTDPDDALDKKESKVEPSMNDPGIAFGKS